MDDDVPPEALARLLAQFTPAHVTQQELADLLIVPSRTEERPEQPVTEPCERRSFRHGQSLARCTATFKLVLEAVGVADCVRGFLD
jgi:hypothetical protein